MKPKKSVLFYLLFFLFIIILNSGCSLQKNYTYENIQKEYAGVICFINQQDSQDKQSCLLKGSISLAEAVKIAIDNNPDQKMAVARIEQAQAMITQADSAFLPSMSFYTEYTRSDAPSVYLFKTIDQRELPPQTNFNDPGSVKNFETGINARMNLYNGSRDVLNKKIAKTGLAVFRLNRELVENKLISSVIQTYYNALAAKDFIQIANESVSTVKQQLKIMKIRFKGGSALKSDILSLEVRLAQSQEEVVQSTNQFKIAVNALANIMGVHPDLNLTLKPAKIKMASIPRQYSAGMEYGLKNRPEFHKARQQVIQSRMALDAAQNAYLPRIDLQARYYLDDEDAAYDFDRDNWMAAIILNWDIFTGFRTRASINKASAVLKETLAADRRAKLSLKMDVKNAYLNLEAAQARLKVAKTSVAMAEESLNLVKKQYEGGAATITRYLEAELDRNRAKIRSTAAFYDREKALADIGRAVGYWGKIGKIE